MGVSGLFPPSATIFPQNPRQVRKEMLLTLPPVLLRVRAQKVHEELYEVVTLLRCADKVRVVTMQMRLIHGMWLITAIEQPQSRTDETKVSRTQHAQTCRDTQRGANRYWIRTPLCSSIAFSSLRRG